MPNLRIADDLELPLEAAVQTFAVLAKRGAGKTYTTLVLVEEMLKVRLQVVVADPVGVTWGLRAAADGKGPGLPIVVLGGDRGDLPLEETSGKLIADLVIDEQISAVLDLSRFRKGEQVRFMTDFAEQLYHRNRNPLHLVLDEADAFAPQRPMPGQQRMLGAVEDIVRRGRARGLGVSLVTQRSAVLNKDVLTQVEVLVALRTIAPQDRAAIDEWIKVHGTPEQREQLMSSLPSLPIGTAWFWSPGWLNVFKRVKIRQRETFDSSATPEVGKKLRAPKQLAEVDLEQLRARLVATVERAKADDPKALRSRIAELERQLRERPTAATTIEVEKRIEVPVLGDFDRDLLSETCNAMARVAGLLGDVAAMARRITESPQLPAPPPGQPIREPVPRIDRVPREHRRPPPAAPAPRPERAESAGLAAVHQKILNAIATLERLGVTPAPRPTVGALSGYSASSGHFKNTIGNLRSRGLAVYPDAESLALTDEGRALAELSVDIRSVQDLHECWYRLLDRAQMAILRVLIENYPEAISREELGERSGYSHTSGHFKNVLGSLRTIGLISYPDANSAVATELLFPTVLR